MVRLGLVDRTCLASFPAGQLASTRGTAAATETFTAEVAKRLAEVVRVCRPGARFVFTYQNRDGRGWIALARALALAGIRPLQAWPMFGDGGAGLHKHANSISWDRVLHCEVVGELLGFELDGDATDAGERFLEEWRARLAEAGRRLLPGDEANFRHAGAVLGSIRPSRAGAGGVQVRRVGQLQAV